MRVWIMLGVGALLFATVALPSGAWGATIDDVKAEMGKMPQTPGSRLELRIPRAAHENMRMPIDQLCVSGGRLRPIQPVPANPITSAGSTAITDMGPVKPGNQYEVGIVEKNIISATGEEKFLAERMVSIPDCK